MLVDYTYVIELAGIAKDVRADYFAVLSSYGADERSMFLYYKTKGQMEESLRQFSIPQVALFRPYFIMRRKKPKLGIMEKARHYIPYFGKGSGILVTDLALVMYLSTKEFLHRQIPGLCITH